jgi:hypothetical protein
MLKKHMKIQGKQLYVSMQCTCIEISMADLRESGESMQFLKGIELNTTTVDHQSITSMVIVQSLLCA